MANLTIRRRKSKQERAMNAVGKACSVAMKFVKLRIAWLAGKKAAQVAVPAAAVGTAAVVAKKRSGQSRDQGASTGVNAVPPTPAGVS